MADIGPQYSHPLPENVFPAPGAPWDADVLPVPRRPRTPLLPHRRPVPVQPHIHATGPQNSVFRPVNAAGNRQPDEHWEDMPPPVDNIAARGEPQDPPYNDMHYYDMAHYPPPPPADLEAPPEYHDRGINYYARVAQGVPAQAHVIAPPAPEINMIGYAGWHGRAGPAQAFLDEWPYQVPVPNEPAREVLRRLANGYLHQPGSQVEMVRMEPGPAGGIQVVITLELADL